MFALVSFLSPLFTSINNSYELHIGDRSLPGFYPLDGVKLALQNFSPLRHFSSDCASFPPTMGGPCWSRLLAMPRSVYSLPMLFEVRMSPQLHNWMFYGSSPAAFGRPRAGGFRPVVFLTQGLELALFAAMACSLPRSSPFAPNGRCCACRSGAAALVTWGSSSSHVQDIGRHCFTPWFRPR